MGKLGKTLIESISAEPTKEIKIIKESVNEIKDIGYDNYGLIKDNIIYISSNKDDLTPILNDTVENISEYIEEKDISCCPVNETDGNKVFIDAIKMLRESEGDVHKVKDCLDDVDMITALEGDTLMIEDKFDWEKVKDLAKDFSGSQGFYGRLLRDMTEYEESVGGPENIEYPIYM